MAKRFFSVLFLAVISLGYLSSGPQPAGSRGIACIDPVADTNILPLPGKLFGEIQDEALRKTTLDYYLFLTKVEMQAIAGRQSIRAMYGINDAAPASVLPSIAPFDPAGNQFATGFLWGGFADSQTKDSFKPGASLPGLTIPPYTVGYSVANAKSSPENTAQGILFPPYNQQFEKQSVAASPNAGIFFPATNRASPKIGAF